VKASLQFSKRQSSCYPKLTTSSSKSARTVLRSTVMDRPTIHSMEMVHSTAMIRSQAKIKDSVLTWRIHLLRKQGAASSVAAKTRYLHRLYFNFSTNTKAILQDLLKLSQSKWSEHPPDDCKHIRHDWTGRRHCMYESFAQGSQCCSCMHIYISY
jgi:hypothetical protein